MREAYLADSHVLLWALHDDPRLSRRHAEILRSDATIFVSIASLWEIAIKVGRGHLQTVDDLPDVLRRAGYAILPIDIDHVDRVRTLPDRHRDPFDRMLIAQAQTEGLTILTADPAFRAYDVRLL